jgi:hypothetical protein
MLDAKDAAHQFANRLRHVKRKGEPLAFAALAGASLRKRLHVSLRLLKSSKAQLIVNAKT